MIINDLIIEGLKNGSERAYAQLFDACYAQLHELAYTYVLDYNAADDIVQEVLIALYEQTELSRISNLRNYLRTAVRNRSFNYLRNLSLETHHRELYIEELLHRERLDEGEITLIYNVLEQEVNKLPRECREICRMRFYEGLKIREIAERLGLSEGTVKTQVHRALRSIEASLKKAGIFNIHPTICIVLAILFSIL